MPTLEPEQTFFICKTCDREQPVPVDMNPEDVVAFARQIGWRLNADDTHTCPFCAGGPNLDALKAVFEGRGKDRLS